MPERFIFPQSRMLVLLFAAALLLVYACFWAGPYALRVLTVAGAYALAALGFQLIFGLCGALSLAQGAFFGVGAYVSGLLALYAGWSFPVTGAAALLAAVGLALAVGAAVLRLESHYFALATLGVAQVALLAVVNGPDWLGGANGLAGVPPVSLFGWTLGRGLPLAGLVWGLVAIGAGLAAWLARGRFGRALALVREDPLTAACLGLDVARLRLAAFALSAGYAGLAGALTAHAQRVVSPETLEFPVMVTLLTIVVVGGRSRAAGAVLGALLVIHLPEWLRGLEQAYLLVYGAALLATMVLAPDGLIGWLERLLPAPRPARQPPSLLGEQATPPPAGPAAVTGWALAAECLCKSYGGVRAADGISFTLQAGEVVGLIGPNGSGKTTLVNLLSGVERADGGVLRLHGAVAPALPHQRARAGVARSFQTPALPDGLTVLQAVAAARYASGDHVAAAEAGVWPLLVRLQLADFADAPCGGLPMGLRRRVDLARALARRPAVLLLDEPAAGLEENERALLAGAVAGAAAAGAAVLVIEHDMGFLLPLCRRVLCMDAGRLIYDGSPDGLLADPAVRAAYFGGVR